MGLWSGTKKALGHVVNFKVDQWLDWQHLKGTALYFFKESKQLFTPEKAQRSESFTEAVERLELSDPALLEQARRYKQLATLFLVIAIALLLYTLYIILFGKGLTAFLTFSLSLYAMARAFQFHFWYFQISEQKLGCSLKDWFQSLLYLPKKTVE